MAPVDPQVANSNTYPLLLLFGVTGTTIAVLVHIARDFRRKASTLPPAQDVRAREARRNRDVAIFGGLALVGFLSASYHHAMRLLWSYREWATDNNEDIPNTLWSGWYANPDGTGLLLGRWMKDTNVGHEGFEIALHKASSLWWSHQQYALLIAWSVFAGFEGKGFSPRHSALPRSYG